MAIAFRSATEALTGAAGTSTPINVPSGVIDGDFLIAVIGTADGDTGSVSLNGTWQGPLVNNLNTGGAAPSPPGVSVYWRIASSEPASYTITDTESSGIAGQMLAFTGVDITTPIDVTTTTATGDSTNANPPSITYSDSGAAIVIGAVWDSTTNVYSAQPSGYTSPSGIGSSIGTGGGNGLNLVSGYTLTPGGTPHDPGAFTSTTEQWAAFTVALRTGITTTYEFNGITKDSSGAALGSCEVQLWKMNVAGDDATFVDSLTSNATTGAYNFTGLPDNDSRYFVIAVKDGTDNVMDTTDHILVPTEV